ncbi:Hsp33 family molecular chaperone HslO [Bdellovibrio bacteriovorus]|uniref:Heat-shock protein Hsp33 n=1 Tax=Bdellovibrio bacteriovorus TaxID=959 RepID=A0A150WU47_BDEBC|nr:Hsp33 family molecular chaperone HslO [Bdellovibrio bacteriovorus]KYG70110.1 heat-shock protein Hsp33 [Bdellovibrio bacteriovorus]
MSKERVHRFVSKDLTVRIAAVNATEVVKHMQDLQHTYPLATVAVGRSMVGAILMASQLKDGQMVGLLFRGNGALQSVYAEASYDGHVRGYTPNPQYQPPSYDNGLSLKEAIGNGTLSVARHQPFQKQPFHGTVELVSGEIGQDIAHYLHQSHQIRSLVSLGVYLDTFGKVQAAGGVLIEVMPGVEDSVVERIQQNYEDKKPNISKMLMEGATPEQLVAPFMDGIPFEELEHDKSLEYFCPCTKDRVVRALETLGEEELQDMINKNEEADVTCQICGKPYKVSVPEIQDIKNRIHKESMH